MFNKVSGPAENKENVNIPAPNKGSRSGSPGPVRKKRRLDTGITSLTRSPSKLPLQVPPSPSPVSASVPKVLPTLPVLASASRVDKVLYVTCQLSSCSLLNSYFYRPTLITKHSDRAVVRETTARSSDTEDDSQRNSSTFC